jgi:hypothetical protein
MRPIEFSEQTKILNKPKDMTDEECSSLPVYTDGKHCISVWRATFMERLRFMFSGKIWLWVVSGQTQPPVSLDLQNPFRKTDNENSKCG